MNVRRMLPCIAFIAFLAYPENIHGALVRGTYGTPVAWNPDQSPFAAHATRIPEASIGLPWGFGLLLETDGDGDKAHE